MYHPRFRLAGDHSKQQGSERAPLSRRVSLLARQIAAWIQTSADYYAAATIYEQLSRLSDAELQRRGLSRASLARDVSGACDRAARPD